MPTRRRSAELLVDDPIRLHHQERGSTLESCRDRSTRDVACGLTFPQLEESQKGKKKKGKSRYEKNDATGIRTQEDKVHTLILQYLAGVPNTTMG